MEFQHSEVFERPVEDVFHHATDPASQLRWVGSLVEVQPPVGGRWEVGAEFLQVHSEAGMRQEMRGEVLAWTPNQEIALLLSHPDFTIRSRTLFTDLGPRTRLELENAIELHSLKLKLAAPMVRGAVASRIEEDYARLRALLEG